MYNYICEEYNGGNYWGQKYVTVEQLPRHYEKRRILQLMSPDI